MHLLFRFLMTVLLLQYAAGCGQKEEKPVKTITVAERSPEPAGVALKIIEPVNGEVIPTDSALIKFSIANWNTEKDGGQVCFILDNQPPVVHHAAEEPFVFSDVPKGAHVVRILLRNGREESLKQEGAFALVQFYAQTEDGYP